MNPAAIKIQQLYVERPRGRLESKSFRALQLQRERSGQRGLMDRTETIRGRIQMKKTMKREPGGVKRTRARGKRHQSVKRAKGGSGKFAKEKQQTNEE